MTHNPAPLHLDAEYMKGTEYGRILVNSCFTLGLMVGISVNDTTQGTAVANLGWDEVRFPVPIFVGDTLRIETEVLDLRESAQPCVRVGLRFEHVENLMHYVFGFANHYSVDKRRERTRVGKRKRSAREHKRMHTRIALFGEHWNARSHERGDHGTEFVFVRNREGHHRVLGYGRA